MPSRITFIEDGTALTAESVNTPFGALEEDIALNSVNSLLVEACSVGTFMREHLGQVIAQDLWTINAVALNLGLITYTNQMLTYSTDSIASPGWAVINDGITNLQIEDGPITVDPVGTDRIGCVLVMGNVNFWDATRTGGDVLPDKDIACVVGLQYKENAGGTWKTIPRATRAQEARLSPTGGTDTVSAVDIPICCLVTAADLGGDVVAGFRLVTAWYFTQTAALGALVDMRLSESSLIVLPLHSNFTVL